MAIADLPVTILNDIELIDLADRLAPSILNRLPNDTWFGPLVADMQSQVSSMNLVLGRTFGSDLTADINNADTARDDAFLTLRMGLEFLERRPEPVGSAAARLLEIVRNRDYSLQALGDREETVQLKALLGDLDQPAAQADLMTVGLSADVEAMRQAQQTFDDLIAQRAAEEAGEELPLLRTVRGYLRQDLEVLRNDIASAERRDPVIWGDLATEMSQPITEVVAMARARRTREKNEQEQPPAEP